MAEVTEQRGDLATELPSKYLPAVEYRDLPEPESVTKYLGASIIILATALGSGELVLWPYITSVVGIGLLWLAIVGFTMQYFLNMEIERYTLATGETAVTGFARIWKPWGIIFALGAILPNAWPGWATGSATLVTYVFPVGEGAIAIIAVIMLISIGLAVTASPVIYQTLEKVQGFIVAFILVFMAIAVVIATDLSAWTGVVTEAPSGAANLPSYFTQLGVASLLGAVAFAGAGGANNLCQSNYIRDKGMGMGQNIPNIVSPVTGEEVAAPSIGYMFPDTEDNRRRWKGWWKVANQEQFFTFYVIGMLTLVGLSVLLFSTLGVEENSTNDISFVQREATALGENIAPWFGTFFLVSGILVLFSTNVGIMDYTARITADSLKVTTGLRDSQFWSESKIYIAVIWTLIVAGSTILLSGLTQPIIMLIIASAGGGVVMALYSVMLIVLNRRALPEVAKLKGWRVPIMILIAIFFVTFSVLLVYDVISTNVFGA